MRRTIGLAVFAVAALSALGFASTAFASFAPKLIVSSTPTGTARIGVVVANTDDPTFRALFYIPNGYQIATPAAGSNLGAVTATASAADLGGAILPLTGSLLAVDPNTLTASQKATAAACLQGAAQSQTWDLRLTAAGQTLDVPLFVLPVSAPEAASGFQAKLQVCLPPPDVPSSNPNRATFGAKLLSATFTASAITKPAATGDYRWTSLWTPYTPAIGVPNAAGSVETQSIVHIPTQVSQTITKKKLTTYRTVRRNGKRVRIKVIRTQVKFSATVDANGAAPTSVSITTTAAGKKVGGASGSFILAAGKSATVTSTALVNHDASVPTGQTATAADLFYSDLGAVACTKSAIFGGLPCVDATVGGDTIKASTVVVGYRR
jgi:hypothetical protein